MASTKERKYFFSISCIAVLDLLSIVKITIVIFTLSIKHPFCKRNIAYILTYSECISKILAMSDKQFREKVFSTVKLYLSKLRILVMRIIKYSKQYYRTEPLNPPCRWQHQRSCCQGS